MAYTVYYFPSDYGAAAADPSGGNGQQTFPAGGAQLSSGYTRVLVDSSDPDTYIVTVGYDSATLAPQTYELNQSNYSDANHNETITSDGSTDFFLQTTPYNTAHSYTFPQQSTDFAPPASFETAPAPVSATVTFTHAYSLNKAGNSFTVGSSAGGNYTIQDYTDPSTSDNLAQLGDIAGDHFTATDTYVNKLSYVGKTAQGIVGESAQGAYYLYTTGTYAQNDSVTPEDQAYNIPCFASGTSILTVRGNVAVETLVIGDVVITSSGTRRPVRWLGHRTIDCQGHSRRREVLPVRIAAGAFADRRPQRDLYVSPGHAICVDILGEVLVAAGALVNGSTIQQVDVAEVTYWHVELDGHDVILAENLPAESYLDMGNRAFFREGHVVDLAAGPDADAACRTHADFCRPFVDGGPVLDAIRAQLQRRALGLGWSLRSGDLAGLHVVADGTRIEPDLSGLDPQFVVPASARKVSLVSETSRPIDVLGTPDTRRLGVHVRKLVIEDGIALRREVGAADARLCVGFHDVEDGTLRWTAGCGLLPRELWEGCQESFVLRIELAGPAVPRWVARPDAGDEQLSAAA